VFLLAAVPLVLRGAPQARAVALLATLGMVVVSALAVQTGKAGGELVYKHGAAAAYTANAGRQAEPARENAGAANEHD